MPDLLSEGPKEARNHLLLAHGAGAPMTSPFMEAITGSLAAGGLRVHRFEFDYMAARRQGGTRRPPPKAELLIASYTDVTQRLASQLALKSRLFIGGKSMGGRVASLAAGELFGAGTISGLVCLGYPFHPPGKPAKLRTAHLAGLECPTLIVQGTHDPLGGRLDCDDYALSAAITFHWIEGGNHDLTPPKRSGRTFEDEFDAATAAIVAFVES